MRKNRKTVTVLLTALAVVFACGCTKSDDPNNGGGSGNNDGGGHYNGNYEYVDLGLPSGTLWATFNLGAAKPEDIGDSFQWGETTPNHSGQNKYYYDGGTNNERGWTKYCWSTRHGYHGYTDFISVLEPSDDAATVNWGNDWLTPTIGQWTELYENIPSTNAIQNGIYGKLFTADNGNTLFLPFGVRNPHVDGIAGRYWSSSLASGFSGDDPVSAWQYYGVVDIDDNNNPNLNHSYNDKMVGNRDNLHCIRPVVNRDGTLNGHDYVDLGLPSGTLWATCNVGSNTPEGSGDYFAWGETEAKSTYEWANYKYCNEIQQTGGNNQIYYVAMLTKYCDNDYIGYNGFVDNITTLEASDDVATVSWGSEWCMPTIEQWQELQDYTTHQWTTQNGVFGQLFTSANHKSIFLPAAGYKDSQLQEADVCGHYWMTILAHNPRHAKRVKFDSDGIQYVYFNGSYDWRYQGKTIRPVRSR